MKEVIACKPASEPPTYAGSIRSKCDTCGCEVWVGPRQQSLREECPSIEAMCFTCAVKLSHDGPTIANHLGNTDTLEGMN